MTKLVKLRPYQVEARDAVIAEWDAGTLNTMISMTMGMGKTESFLGILAEERKRLQAAQRPFRALIVAHREELIRQPQERVQKGWRDRLPIPGIVMASENDADAEIVIATIQTIMRRKRNGDTFGRFWRLREVVESGGIFTHVIVDECHHATSPTYIELIRALRWMNPDLRHVGVTATPKRSDGEGLIKVYQSVAFRKGIKEAVEDLRVLSPFVGMGFTLPVSLNDAKIVAGDYTAGSLNDLLSADNVEQVIVKKWKEHASDRPTIVFTAGVQQAYRLAAAFQSSGVVAEAADGTTDKAERRRIISEFKRGKTQILVNCMLYTEGFDAPHTSCVVMARPTRSSSLYLQAVGRGLRLHPAKSDCLIMDFAPMDGRDLMMSGDLLGVPKEQRKRQEKAEEDDTILDVFGLFAKRDGIDADPDHVLMKVLDFFSTATSLRFTHDGRVATASVNKTTTIAVVFPQEDRMANADDLRERGIWSPSHDALYDQISGYTVAVVPQSGSVKVLGVERAWEDALKTANDWAEQRMDDTIAKKSARWRNGDASDKQVKFATRLGVWKEGMTKGQTAQAITHKLAINSLCQSRIILS